MLLSPARGKRRDTVGEFAGLAESGHLTGSRFVSGTLPGGPKPA
jgi:hypothetical protein